MAPEHCPRGPGYHVHIGPAAVAASSFVMAVGLGTDGRWLGVVPALLLLTAVTYVISIRHLDPGTSGGG